MMVNTIHTIHDGNHEDHHCSVQNTAAPSVEYENSEQIEDEGDGEAKQCNSEQCILLIHVLWLGVKAWMSPNDQATNLGAKSSRALETFGAALSPCPSWKLKPTSFQQIYHHAPTAFSGGRRDWAGGQPRG
jgi:hypothetical protein